MYCLGVCIPIEYSAGHCHKVVDSGISTVVVFYVEVGFPEGPTTQTLYWSL